MDFSEKQLIYAYTVFLKYVDLVKRCDPNEKNAAYRKWEKINEIFLKELKTVELAVMNDALVGNSIRSISNKFRLSRPYVEKTLITCAKVTDRLLKEIK